MLGVSREMQKCLPPLSPWITNSHWVDSERFALSDSERFALSRFALSMICLEISYQSRTGKRCNEAGGNPEGGWPHDHSVWNPPPYTPWGPGDDVEQNPLVEAASSSVVNRDWLSPSLLFSDAESQCYAGSGEDYRGTKSVNELNERCLNWDSSLLKRWPYNTGVENAMELGLGKHNYCRYWIKTDRPQCSMLAFPLVCIEQRWFQQLLQEL